MSAFLASMPPGSVCAVIGAPGTGKTRAIQEADRHEAFPRRVVYDPFARLDRSEARRKGAKSSPWRGWLITPDDLMDEPEILDCTPCPVVVCPKEDLDPSQHGPHFEAVSRVVWTTRGVDLIAEECGAYTRDSNEVVFKMASGGRHARMRLILSCQSLGRIHKDGRRHLTHVVAFAQAEPSDLKDLEARCGREFAARVQTLRLGLPPETWCLGSTAERKYAS